MRRESTIWRGAIATLMMISSAALATGLPDGEDDVEILTVAQAVQEAMARNPLLQEATENIDGAAAAIGGARSAFFPTLAMSYSYTGLRDAPVSELPTGTMRTAHRDQFGWDASATLPLFTGFSRTARLQMANVGVRTAETDRWQNALDLALDVKTAAYDLLLAEKLAQVAEEEVQALTAHRDDARRFFQEGLIPNNDLLRSEVALANAIQQRELAEATVALTRGGMNVLLDAPVDRALRLVEVADDPSPPAGLADLVAEALHRRPAIRQLDLADRSLGLQEKLARSSYYPEVVLSGSYQQNGGDWGATYNDFTNDHNLSVRLQANWTVFDWGRTGSEVSGVRSDRRALAHTRRETENRIALHVQGALLDLEVARKNVATAAASLDQARENWRVTSLQYDQQVATSTDVLDARSFLSQADSNYFRALYGNLAARAHLDRALGRPCEPEGVSDRHSTSRED